MTRTDLEAIKAALASASAAIRDSLRYIDGNPPHRHLPDIDWLAIVGRQASSALALVQHAMDNPAVDGWQPIETAPKGDGRDILMAGKSRSSEPWRLAVAVVGADGCPWNWPYGFPPTHWQPLPSHPEAGDG